jgi:hypothetical protein
VRSLAFGVALAVLSAPAAIAASQQALDLSDGVNQSEAQRIADRLFGLLVGCGAAGDPKRVGSHWEVPTKLGYAGQAGPSLQIDAKSGAMTWGSSCRLIDPRALYRQPEELSCEVPWPAAQ